MEAEAMVSLGRGRAAKRFRWEAAHRLPWHGGLCRSLHGHSYTMWVEVEGWVGHGGMIVDFHSIKRVLAPLVEAWDHATLVAEDDGELLGVLRQTGWKHYVLPFDSTAENVARYAAAWLDREAGALLATEGATAVHVRVHETETCYAMCSLVLSPAVAGDGAAVKTVEKPHGVGL